jgi:hypothetical protein
VADDGDVADLAGLNLGHASIPPALRRIRAGE